MRYLAVAVADGGDHISDLGVLRGQEALFGVVASETTAHRAHSEKQGAAGNYKGGFGFHPLLCYLAETGEPLAGILRPGNAAAHTAADHFEVLQLALEQLPEADLGREILVRADIGGPTHAFTEDCRDAGIRFWVGYEVNARVREAIGALGNRLGRARSTAMEPRARAPRSQSSPTASTSRAGQKARG